MLLDIAKESADAFLPLKSCLGGISALIKHYDVRPYRVTPSYTNEHHPAISRREGQARRSHPVVREVTGYVREGGPKLRP